MSARSNKSTAWKKYLLPALSVSVLLILGTALWLRPYFSARFLIWQLGRQDEASLSQITLDIDINTYEQGLPKWCMFDLEEATLKMLRTRYGSSVIKRYVRDRPEGMLWYVAPIDATVSGPHSFQFAGGIGNDSVYFVLRHKPGTFDSSGLLLQE